jgi:FkbM family methyltransferase
MTYSDLLLLYARKGPFRPFRDSAFRKFCRRNQGRSFRAQCVPGFAMNTTIGDSVDDQICVYGVWEEGTTQVIAALAAESAAFVDVGCNIGYYSCLFGSQHPAKRLFAVDPNPAMAKATEANLKLNGITNYRVLNCAIGQQHGTLQLHVPRGRHSLSSLAYVPQKGGAVDAVDTAVVPLSEVILENAVEAGLVKIDTEGFEQAVFGGLSEAAAERIRFIVFELSAANLRLAGSSPAAILALPILQRFAAYVVHDEEGGFIEAADPARLLADDDLNVDMLLVGRDAPSSQAFQRVAIRRR